MPSRSAADHGRVALGARVKSGWACAVILGGAAAAPRVLERRTLSLSDPDVPETRQPHHPALALAPAVAATTTARLVSIVERSAARAIEALIAELAAAGQPLAAMGLVVGSLIDPTTVPNPHVRAHALEGQLFRRVLEDGARTARLPCVVMRERDCYAEAATVLDRPAAELKRRAAELGKSVGGPWRADEKTAALVAWVALARSG